MSTQQIEDRIMAERRPQGMPPTPGNPALYAGYSAECELMEEGDTTTFHSLEEAISEAGECCTIRDPWGLVVRAGE